MKHFFLFIISLLICSHINGEAPFKINGKIDDANVDTIFFKPWICEKDSSVVDTVSVINGTFKIEGIISQGTLATLSVNDKEVTISIDPGEMQLYLKKDSLEKFVLYGSKSQRDSEILETQTKPLIDSLWSIKRLLKSDQSKQNKDFLLSQRDSIENIMENISYEFIASHPDSYSSLDAISSLIHDIKKENGDKLMSLFNGLSENIRKSCRGEECYRAILQREKLTISNVSSLEAFDKNGTLVRLSDYKGKYILIDFWASWCVPCIKGLPHLKELYSKYKDKGLVVISISIDFKKDEQKWLNAIEKNDISEWIQILACKNEGEYNICDLYEFGSGIPYYILINPLGNVLKRWESFGNTIAEEQNVVFENIFGKP